MATNAMGGAADAAADNQRPPEGQMTTIRAPHASNNGQGQRGNGGQQRRRGAEGGRAAGKGRVARRTADVGGAGAGGRAIRYLK